MSNNGRIPIIQFSSIHVSVLQAIARTMAGVTFACSFVATSYAEQAAPFINADGHLATPLMSIPQDWAGIRAMGMGNAFTTIGNDELAVFSNPAGLARSRNPRSRSGIHEGSFPNLAVGFNAASLDAIKSPQRPVDWSDRIRKSSIAKETKIHTIEAQVFPYSTFGGKGSPTYFIGFPARSESLFLSSSGKTLLISEFTSSAALAVGGTTRAGLFAWGLSTRPNIRYSKLTTDLPNNKFQAAQLKDFAQNSAVRTSAVPVDAGILITAADYWFPTLGLAVRNIPTGCKENYVNPATGKAVTMCGTLRQKISGSAPLDETTGAAINLGNTEIDPTEVRAGFSITPRGRIDGTKINLRLALDVFPIPISDSSKQYGINDTNPEDLVHAGAELFLGNALIDKGFALRVGVQNTQPTFGASIGLWGVSLEFAHYVVRTGLGSTQTLDKRYLAGLSMGW